MKIKFIGMVLLSSFIGIVLNPEILAASDSVAVMDLERSSMVETVIKMVPVQQVLEKTPEETVKRNTVAVTAPVQRAVAPAAPKAGLAMQNQIKFSWGSQSLVISDTTRTNAGNGTVKVGKMIYGHNYTDFGKITNLKIGDTFSVTVNGVTKKYQVAANPIDGTKGLAAKVINVDKGELYHERIGNFYVSALKNGWRHDLVLLTCYGADSRYIVVADEI